MAKRCRVGTIRAAKTPPGDAWTIEDGCLKANPHPRITEDLFTSKTYSQLRTSLGMAHRLRRAIAG